MIFPTTCPDCRSPVTRERVDAIDGGGVRVVCLDLHRRDCEWCLHWTQCDIECDEYDRRESAARESKV